MSTQSESIDISPAISEPVEHIATPKPVVIEAVAELLPAKLPAPPSPKLATAQNEPPVGPIVRIMTAALELAKGQRVELGQCYVRYAAECKGERRKPVSPDVFMDGMAWFCKSVGIKTKIVGGKLYLLNVQLVPELMRSSQS
jgi:hypothetical protein